MSIYIRKPILPLALWLPSLLLIASCASSIRVVNERVDDPGDISVAKTYCWDNGTLTGVAVGERRSSQYSSVIKKEIDANLIRLGYQKNKVCPADMMVGFRVTIRDDVEGHSPQMPFENDDLSSDFGLKWRFGGGERAVGIERATPANEVTFYEEGTLHIGVFDRNRKMSWHVSARKIIDKSHLPNEHYEVLRKTVGLAMKAFPSNAGES